MLMYCGIQETALSSNSTAARSRARGAVSRVPQQERSHARLESILVTATRLFSAHGYEAVSMREISREAGIPIASLYMYFPTKLSIIRELWTRYAQTVSTELGNELEHMMKDPMAADAGSMINSMIDLMVSLQESQPVFMEMWGCVLASPELRELNAADTLKTAGMISRVMRRRQPLLSKDAADGLGIVLCEAASSATQLALALPKPARARTLRQVKQALRRLYEGVMRDPD